MVCQNKIAKKALKKQPSHFTTPLNVALYFITYFRGVLLLWFRGSVVFCRFFDRTAFLSLFDRCFARYSCCVRDGYILSVRSFACICENAPGSGSPEPWLGRSAVMMACGRDRRC